MNVVKRSIVVAVSLAILVVAATPAAAAQHRVFVSPAVAIEWNANAVAAVRASSPTKFQAEGMLYMAYVQAAVYDAATKIAGRYRPYHAFAANTAGASVEAAVVSAAYNTLVAYLGDPDGTLAAKYTASLATLPDAGKAAGVAVGAAAAADLVVLRTGDGRNAATATYGAPGPVVAGHWQVVPPATVAQTPWVAFMTPFLLTSASQFRLPPPPALTSALYARDLNEVKLYGAISPARDADPAKAATAFFWNANVINQYNKALQDLAVARHMDLLDTVRLFAMGTMVTADAGIACFDSKYFYLFWRPTTAIRNADLDGNSATTKDSSWTSVINMPNHPEYPSAHGCLTTAFVLAVAHALGTRHIDLDMPGATSTGAITETRHFDTVKQVERELGDARVWLGFHYRFSVTAGVRLGEDVARYTLHRYFGRAGNGHGHGDDGDDNDEDEGGDD